MVTHAYISTSILLPLKASRMIILLKTRSISQHSKNFRVTTNEIFNSCKFSTTVCSCCDLFKFIAIENVKPLKIETKRVVSTRKFQYATLSSEI